MLHLTRQLEDLSLKEVSARLARYILERCQETHGKIEKGMTFELPTTKTHLAAYLGTISETLSRTLSRFKSLGVIEVDKGKITIIDPATLQNMAREINLAKFSRISEAEKRIEQIKKICYVKNFLTREIIVKYKSPLGSSENSCSYSN